MLHNASQNILRRICLLLGGGRNNYTRSAPRGCGCCCLLFFGTYDITSITNQWLVSNLRYNINQTNAVHSDDSASAAEGWPNKPNASNNTLTCLVQHWQIVLESLLLLVCLEQLHTSRTSVLLFFWDIGTYDTQSIKPIVCVGPTIYKSIKSLPCTQLTRQVQLKADQLHLLGSLILFVFGTFWILLSDARNICQLMKHNT